MKNILKKLVKYIGIFCVSVLVLFSLLIITSKIPQASIEKSMQESASFYNNKHGLIYKKTRKPYSILHYYADSMILNIIYNIDTNNPVSSTLWSNYYQTRYADQNDDFVRTVKLKREANTQYLRYWHGSMVILRPLLTMFNIEQIYLLNKVLLSILALVLFIMLLKKSKIVAFVFLLALILVASWYVPFCLEYTWTFYIMLIVSIIALRKDDITEHKNCLIKKLFKINKKEKKQKNNDKNEKLYVLFFITGIVTCFLDFLSTEILTIFVPLLLVLAIRKKENRLEEFKKTLKFVIKICVLWLVGYALMWLAKWCISSLVLGINAFDYVKNNAMLRINGLQGDLTSKSELYGNVINRNVELIPIISLINSNFYKWEVKLAIIIIIILLFIFIDWKNLKKKKFSLVMLFIGIMPYIRYLILANHSFRHAMFTFRDQIITIMALSFILIDCLNYNFLLKKVHFKKERKQENEQNPKGSYLNDINNLENNKNTSNSKYKELTILIPCLNEEQTIGTCIKKAKQFLIENNINGEILVADNGSTDNSKNIALGLGVRVIEVEQKGYGNALINGTKHAKGKYTIMGDADDSYSFLEILPILEKLRQGYDFVIGNRYKGKMEKGAMPFSHKYIGTPIISWIGRKKYKLKIGDFNCGLRGYDTQKIIDLNCECPGMEYATEMIIKAKQADLKITEVPINFYKDGRNRKPHLKAIPDGFRHLKVLVKSQAESISDKLCKLENINRL